MVKIKQLSIFLTNQKGRLYNVLNILAENNINIRALSLTDTSEFGILRLIVDNPDKGEQILEANNYTLKTTQAISVELEDVPGGLVSILKILNDNEINLNILYAFTQDYSDKAILFLSIPNLDFLIKILKENSISLVPSNVIYNL